MIATTESKSLQSFKLMPTFLTEIWCHQLLTSCRTICDVINLSKLHSDFFISYQLTDCSLITQIACQFLQIFSIFTDWLTNLRDYLLSSYLTDCFIFYKLTPNFTNCPEDRFTDCPILHKLPPNFTNCLPILKIPS